MTSGEASGGWGPSGEAAGGLLVRPRGCTFHRESSRACSVCDLKGSYLEICCHTFDRCNFQNCLWNFLFLVL